MPLSFVPATAEHAADMAPRLREADVHEVTALGLTPSEALDCCLLSSIFAETCLEDDTPAAMWGVAPERTLLSEKGLVWMLGTEAVPRHAYTVLLTSKAFIARAQAAFPVLECLVDMRYAAAMRWVRWLGFEQEAEITAGGVPFAVMRRRRA
jgi:hypothetical protein